MSFVVTVIVVYVSSFWWMTPFITYITRAHVSLHAFSFTEMIQIYVMIIFFIAFCFISPVMFFCCCIADYRSIVEMWISLHGWFSLYCRYHGLIRFCILINASAVLI
nr:hypothetical protein [Staphylococcus aureus]